MVSTITGSQSPSVLAGLSTPQTTPSGSTASFTEQLAAALEGYLAQSGNNSKLEIDIQSTQSQNSGTRQFIVTVKDSAPRQTDSAAGNAAPASTPASSVQTTSAPAASVQQANTPQSTAADDATQANLTRAEIDAYWAAQPPAVQQLRNVVDYSQRSAMAQDLADQGYTIDKAIMVWGWDPLKTMLTRQMYGYTWVPNLNQPNVSGPAFTLPGQTPYDPGHPPPGAIAVNTDFAKGLNITNPWA
jgi:hypothetical protein